MSHPPHRSVGLLSFALLVIAGLGLLGFGGGSGLPRRSPPEGPAPVWERPERPQEASLLQAALARPADPTAQVRLGRYYLTARRPFEALWALQRARDARGSSATSDTELTLAMADALETGMLPARALALLAEAAARHPDDAALAERRARLQLRLGRHTEAIAYLRPVLENPGKSSDERATVLLLLGRAREAAGDETGALVRYRRCVAADPSSVEATLHLGHLLIRRRELAEGRAALERAHRLAPTAPEPLYALGMSFMPEAVQNADPARYWLTQALQLSPGYGPACVALGRMGVIHRRWLLAAQQFAAVLRVDPWDPEALLGLAEALEMMGHRVEAHERRGMAYVRQGKLSQALAEFRALKVARPEDRAVSLLIIQTLIQMTHNAGAAEELKIAIARHPRDTELRERLAQVAILTHTPDLARRVCTEWLRIDPDAARPAWLLGRVALIEPQVPEAVDAFERAARIAPRDPEILFALGEALSRAGPRRDPGRALELLARSVELAPSEARYRYQLGLLLQAARPEPARRQFLRALDLDPGLTAASMGLVQVSARLREAGQIALFAPVIRYQQEAARVEADLRRRTYQWPMAASGYVALARYLADRGDLEAARAQWEVVLTLTPDDGMAHRELARLNRILELFRPPLQPWRGHLEQSHPRGLAPASVRGRVGLHAAISPV